MTIELKFPPNVIETNLNIKGVKVQIKKCNEDEYQIWIEDEENRFLQGKLPRGYWYLGENNNITLDDTAYEHKNWWWSSGYNSINQNYRNGGYFKNGEKLNYKQLTVILESIENGVNKLEEIYSKCEIIKIGNVTIEKKQCNSDTVCLSIDGLIHSYEYPSEITCNGDTVYLVNHDDFTIYDINDRVVVINNRCYFPIKDFKVSNEDADKIIKIITASEEKLAKYKNKIKVGDIVRASTGTRFKVICIDGDMAWCKGIDAHFHIDYSLHDLKKIEG